MDEDVGFAVELTMMCKQLGCLPGPGGLLDQDVYHVHLMGLVLNAMAMKEDKELEEAKRRAK